LQYKIALQIVIFFVQKVRTYKVLQTQVGLLIFFIVLDVFEVSINSLITLITIRVSSVQSVCVFQMSDVLVSLVVA